MKQNCPKCRGPLVTTSVDRKSFLECQRCGGRLLEKSVLARLGASSFTDTLGYLPLKQSGKGSMKCVDCGRPLVELPTEYDGKTINPDVCTICHMIWLEPDEFDHMVRYSPDLNDESASGAVSQVEVGVQTQTDFSEPEIVKHLTDKYGKRRSKVTTDPDGKRTRKTAFVVGEPPDRWWKWIPGLFLMPVRSETGPFKFNPRLTWALAAAIILVFILTIGDIQTAAVNWGLVPAEFWRHGGVTFITNFFLHAGLIHLIGNMWFLLVFGNDVEGAIGVRRYVILLTLSALVGDIAHILGDVNSTIPCIGASGGISGVLMFYALKFPRRSLSIVMWLFFVPIWVRLPALAYVLVCFVLLQILGMIVQLSGVTDVSYLAHMGGASVGFLLWLRWGGYNVEETNTEPTLAGGSVSA
ncbi:MAG: rhomboid family intramembrane serine protease [Chloroflexota bacterium]|nr:rhomboid family intramembrane serine protease [Chloroflexota bacterium]